MTSYLCCRWTYTPPIGGAVESYHRQMLLEKSNEHYCLIRLLRAPTPFHNTQETWAPTATLTMEGTESWALLQGTRNNIINMYAHDQSWCVTDYYVIASKLPCRFSSLNKNWVGRGPQIVVVALYDTFCLCHFLSLPFCGCSVHSGVSLVMSFPTPLFSSLFLWSTYFWAMTQTILCHTEYFLCWTYRLQICPIGVQFHDF